MPPAAGSSAAISPTGSGAFETRTAQRKALVVPTAAIHGDAEQRFVYLRTDQGFRKAAVTLGFRETAFTEIKKGLSPGDRLVLGEISPESVKGMTP